MRLGHFLLTFAAVSLGACSSSTTPGSDVDATAVDASIIDSSGTDSAPTDANAADSAVDATSTDAKVVDGSAVDSRPVDAVAVDAAQDAAVDAAIDAAVDAAPPDAAVDAATDAAIDAQVVDAAPPDAATDPCSLAFFDSQGNRTRTLAPVFAACTYLQTEVVFQRPDGTNAPYSAWTTNEKARLQQIYEALYDSATLPVTCPDPTTQRQIGAGATSATALFFPATQAFDLYAAQIANALYVEIFNVVPWSLRDLPQSERRILLHSDSLFATVRPSAAPEVPSFAAPNVGFQSTARRSNAPSYVCDPRDGLSVMRGPGNRANRNLIGPNRLDTLKNITFWFGANAGHGAGAMDAVLPTYGYSLKQRLQQWTGSAGMNAVWGCQSAAVMIADLARSVNLPLLVGGSQDLADTRDAHYLNRTHAGLVYGIGSATPLILQHADDIYALRDKAWLPSIAGSMFGDLSTDRDRFFSTKWQTATQLEGFGFSVRVGFPLVIPGVDLGQNGRGVYETYYDYGHYIGGWRRGQNDPLTMNFSSRSLGYFAEGQYQLCGNILVTDFCSGVPFEDRLNVVYYGGALSSEQPTVRTANDYIQRMNECIAPIGGCANLNTYQSSWFSTRYGTAVGN